MTKKGEKDGGTKKSKRKKPTILARKFHTAVKRVKIRKKGEG